MKNPSTETEVFPGLPVEHCPLCGELIFIEKSEIMQLEEIDCIFCKRSIKAYLPKFEEQLFFTKECNNCEKMNNTRTQYCVYCGDNFTDKRRIRLPKLISNIVEYLASGFSILGVVLIFLGLRFATLIAGYVLIAIGISLGIFNYFNKKYRKMARLSLIISGVIVLIAIIVSLIGYFVF